MAGDYEWTLTMHGLMYSRKSVGPKMEPWGTPVLSGYSCEDCPSRATRSCLLLRKDKVWANIRPEMQQDLDLCDKTSMPNPVKSLCYIKWYSSNSPRSIKRLATLSNTIVRRSSVDWEDLKP